MGTAAGEYTDARAHELRARYHERFGGAELPVPVEAIAEDLAGLAVKLAASLEVSGALFPTVREIVVRSDEPAERRRFTIAHELGHWFCHCVGRAPAPVYCRAEDLSADVEGPARALEREANIFAAELLMPEAAVRAEWSRLEDPSAVAKRFGVSDLAMCWRLYSFELLEYRPV
jgi:Zn-dependent peptidase ImmA (M78 family)